MFDLTVLRDDAALFDNAQTVTLEVFDPLTETWADPLPVTALKTAEGESAGLTVADTGVGDGGLLDGQITSFIVWTDRVAKYHRLTAADGRVYVVDSTSKGPFSASSTVSCRDA